MRLNKFLAKSGIASRRKSDELIKMAMTTVNNEIILDQLISEDIKQFIDSSNTIIWNGPLGVFENKNFSEGTEELSKLISMSDAYTLAGGGETLSAINQFINKEDISYCSTAGGAFLEFIEGKELPSISALSD